MMILNVFMINMMILEKRYLIRLVTLLSIIVNFYTLSLEDKFLLLPGPQ